jgi:magnesium transporter
MALGQVAGKDWLRVLRHEIVMGLILGATLGLIGFFRASLTPESVRSSAPSRPEPFQVKVSKGTRLKETPIEEWFEKEPLTVVHIPPDLEQSMVDEHATKVGLPRKTNYEIVPDPNDPQVEIYKFPGNCKVFHPPVDRYRLSLVIAFAVASICLWGTLVGSMLPLILKRLGRDPGYASSPFVATAVDVTGIVIYFLIAKSLLSDYLG